jgi:hypothetical protein
LFFFYDLCPLKTDAPVHLCTLLYWLGRPHLATGINVAVMYPPLTLFKTFSWSTRIATCAVIIIPFAVAILLFTSEYTDTTKRFRNILAPLLTGFHFSRTLLLLQKTLLIFTAAGALSARQFFPF